MSDRRTTIVLTCTDDGQHRERMVYRWIVDETTTAEAMVATLPGSYLELDDCPLCPRTPRIRGVRLTRLCEYLLARVRSGERRVTEDVSKLPM